MKQRRQALNEAGKDYGIEYNKSGGTIPDMPNGAVLLVDADERRKIITEIFLDNTSVLKKFIRENTYEDFYYFISEENRTMVINNWMYSAIGNPSLAYIYNYLNLKNKKKFVLMAKENDPWTIENADNLISKYHESFSTHLDDNDMYELGLFFYNETHNPNSPYYDIDNETPETVIDNLIYNSLVETQALYDYSNSNFPIVPIGNKIDTSILSDDVWIIYCITDRYAGEFAYRVSKEVALEWIGKDYRLLLEHHFNNASDMS